MRKEWQEASRQGDLARIRRLIGEGTDLNSKDQHGQTALMNAAHAGQLELVRLLVEAGADLNVTAKYHLSALMLSLISQHPEVARFLIEAGANIDIRSSQGFQEKTALSLAEERGYREIADLLKQKGAIE